jgi:hypothetical protein
MKELLAKGILGEIPQNADSHCLTSLILNRNCQAFYLIYDTSPEELQTSNRAGWELMRDFSTHSFPPNVLQKFIAVRIYEESEGNAYLEEVEGPILTVNLSLRKWRESPKECAKLIQSRAWANRNDPDGDFSYSQTSSSLQDSPPIHAEFLPNDTDRDLLQASTNPHTLQVPEMSPVPKNFIEPHIGRQIVNQLQNLNETIQRNLQANQETANNTRGMAEAQGEIRDITADTNEVVHRSRVGRDASEGV